MKLPYQTPDPSGTERAHLAKEFRDLATEIARLRPQAATRANGEESDHAPTEDGVGYAANFTKGLAHNQEGVLVNAADYHCFVEAINSPDRTLFEKSVPTAASHNIAYSCNVTGITSISWRGWESPRSGHVYELEGPDAGAVAMAPAPKVGSSELSAEMAEVYSLALLRDVPFSEIEKGGDKRLCDEKSPSHLSAAGVVDALNTMPYFSGVDCASSTMTNVDDTGLNRFERARRQARTGDDLFTALTTQNVFRGSSAGAQEGPYISQFLLAGTDSISGGTGGTPSYPGISSAFDAEDGFIAYGTQIVDQRVHTHLSCLDYMTTWPHWLDVQNGANFKGADQFESERRFITTPRDLATYVHFDALYQAYLNACLILLSTGAPTSKGFPEPSISGKRDAFATFGGPHILSLVTEVATRCLKAVRRQKFNYHRRSRPELIGGRLTLVDANKHTQSLGAAAAAFEQTFNEIPTAIKDAIKAHNIEQNTASVSNIKCKSPSYPCKLTKKAFGDSNLLLPMAFPEGSPMHPAYGAGHATVAGGCITMLKAFFEMYDSSNVDVAKLGQYSNGRRILKIGDKDYFEPNATGKKLVNKTGPALTIQGELDKLAANISIGRNMAGVHYYSDYYDSLRMGERMAIGILMEQAPTYGDAMETTFDSFDGDAITISGEAGTCPSLLVMDKQGNTVSSHDWWLRHAVGEDIVLDL